MAEEKLESMQAGYEYGHLLQTFFADKKIRVNDWDPQTNTIIIECDDPMKYHMLDMGIKKDAKFRDIDIKVEVNYTGLSNPDGLSEEEYDLLLKGNDNYEGLIAAETDTVSLIKAIVFKEKILHYSDGNFFDPWCAGHVLAQDVAKLIFKKKVPFSTMINFPEKDEEEDESSN